MGASVMHSLEGGGLHLFYTRADSVGGAFLDRCREVLSPGEIKKAERFRQKEARHLSMVSRALVRYLVSQYTGQAPEALQFKTNTYGKPSLVTDSTFRGPDIRFNISHCKGAVICGLCLGREIGVDLENTARRVNPAVAERFFSPAEAARVREVAGEAAQNEAFLETWTLKEAYIKAEGRGLSIPLTSFSFDRLDPQIRISFKNREDMRGGWQFFRWRPESGKLAAAAVRSSQIVEMKTFYCIPFKEIVDGD